MDEKLQAPKPEIRLTLKGVGDEIRYVEFIMDGRTRLLSKKRFVDMFGQEVLDDYTR